MTSWTKLPDNTTAYTNVPKPVGTTSTVAVQVAGGIPIGLLLALTQSSVIGQTSVVTSLWTNVGDNATSWTDVPKAS